jgi:ferritin-like metal-binding protein YciE
MPDHSLEEQLTKYLTDAHSIELQAVTQLKAAPRIAGDGHLAGIFNQHLAETVRQERLVRDRLVRKGAATSKLKDVVGRVTGYPFVLFAWSQPDTPGKLVAHAFSYEHMELATYEFLIRLAQRVGDEETADMAREIRDEEGTMIERLSGSFDAAVEASLRTQDPPDLDKQLVKYLTDAHAIETQAVQLLQRGPKIASDPELRSIYADHLRETFQQQRLVEERVRAQGASPSKLKDTAMRLGARGWGAFMQAQPDTAAKLAGFAFAFEHLEIAAYELLLRVAERAGDTQTVETSQRIRDEERAMAERLFGAFDAALDASLRETAAVG